MVRLCFSAAVLSSLSQKGGKLIIPEQEKEPMHTTARPVTHPQKRKNDFH